MTDQADEILLLFTSNARPLYRRDLLNVCTWPRGAQIRFCYDKDWITDDAKPKIAKGALVLIIYCELKKTYTFGTEKREISGNLRFCPVRKAEIVAVKYVDGALLVDLKLGDFFKPDEKDNQPGPQHSFQDYILSLPGNPDTSEKRKRRYLLSGSGVGVGSLAYTADCLPIINYARRLNGLKDCYFICGLDSEILEKGKTATASPEPASNLPVIVNVIEPKYCFPQHEFRNEKNWHTLKAGKDYRVRLLVIPGKDASPDKVPKLSIEETIPTVSVLGPFVKQNPFGFRTDFIVRCKNSLAEEWGAFFVKANPADEKEVYKSSEIFGLIKVEKDNWYIGIFIFIPLSIFFTFTGPDFLKEFVDHPWNKFMCNYIACPTTSFVSIIFKFIGVAFSLWASYLLTNKISFK